MLNRSPRPIAVECLESVQFLHGLEFFLNVTLIFDKAAVHIRGAMHVHARFPVIQEQVLTQVAFDQDFGAHCQIKNGFRNERDAVYFENPRRFDPAHDRARHERVDVAVGKNNETGPKRRNDPVLELVGEIRGIKQAERSRAQNVSAHGLLQLPADEHGSLQADVYRRIAAAFKPVPQQIDLR